MRVCSVSPGFCLRRLALCEMPMCISTAQARAKWGSRFAGFRRSTFTGARCSFIELRSFFVAGVGLPGHFWSLERRFAWQVRNIGHFFIQTWPGAFCTLLKRWQAWLDLRWFWKSFSWQARYLDDVLKGSKGSFCEAVVMFALWEDLVEILMHLL